MTLKNLVVAGATSLALLVTSVANARDLDPQKGGSTSSGGGGIGSSGGSASGGSGSSGSSGGGGGSSSSGGGGSSSSSGGGGGSMSSGGFGGSDGGRSSSASRGRVTRSTPESRPKSSEEANRVGSANTTRASSGSGTTADAANAARRSGVPAYSRNRGNNPAIGQAIERGNVPIVVRPGNGYYNSYYPYNGYYPYYPSFGYGYYNPWYYNPWYSPWYNPYYYGAFGLGYFYYDPWFSNYGWSGGGGGTSYGSGQYQDTGALRLKVKPRDAQVYVDGYYVGIVDDFDGTFQKLTLDAGPHRVEIRAPGFESVVFDVRIEIGETVNYQRELIKAPK
jgi:hypothetical protein